MNKPSTDLEPYIDRGLYNETLRTVRSENDPSQLIGRRNPYTGRVIVTVEDADAYLQQLALSVTYKKAAGAALSKVRSGYESEISGYKDQILTLKKQRRRPFLALLLICAAFYVGSQAGSSSSQAPASSPYRSTGITYTQPTKAPSSYSPATAKPTAKPKATAKPTAKSKPKATPKPKTTNYKTKPKSGYSLTRTVYVSDSGHKIHLRSNCSGMKYYTKMTYGEACERGYTHCKKCF